MADSTKIGFEKNLGRSLCSLGTYSCCWIWKVIVGLIFLRYISSAFEKRYEELLKEGDGFENDRDAYAEENIFLCQKKLVGARFLPLHTHLKLVQSLMMQWGQLKTIVAILKPFNNCRVYDPCCGFRVIIMTQANSQVNTRVLELLPKFKIKKMNSWCAV